MVYRIGADFSQPTGSVPRQLWSLRRHRCCWWLRLRLRSVRLCLRGRGPFWYSWRPGCSRRLGLRFRRRCDRVPLGPAPVLPPSVAAPGATPGAVGFPVSMACAPAPAKGNANKPAAKITEREIEVMAVSFPIAAIVMRCVYRNGRASTRLWIPQCGTRRIDVPAGRKYSGNRDENRDQKEALALCKMDGAERL